MAFLIESIISFLRWLGFFRWIENKLAQKRINDVEENKVQTQNDLEKRLTDRTF